MTADPLHVRMAEALLFAAVEPLDESSLQARLPEEADVPAVLAELATLYQGRGVTLLKVGGRWTFVTAPDLAFLLQEHREVTRRLSRAAVETLAIIAYHQPVTRAEIEEIRGVSLSKGTLDVLLEAGWIRLRGRRRVPGRPVTYGTTDAFLIHFGLEGLQDLPGLDELKAAGLLDPALRSEAPFGPGAPGGAENDGEEPGEDPLDEPAELAADEPGGELAVMERPSRPED